MNDLVTARNLEEPDAAYDLLISAHEGMSAEESAGFNARLILTLVNHLGDIEVLRQAIAVAELRKDTQ